jgi:hypothetical protein
MDREVMHLRDSSQFRLGTRRAGLLRLIGFSPERLALQAFACSNPEERHRTVSLKLLTRGKKKYYGRRAEKSSRMAC